ncbi:MAG: hypothetical protein QF921_12030 [Pseudomonadales bacterium]|nr:hypothetical protein [Pseudomonadales bacterium]
MPTHAGALASHDVQSFVIESKHAGFSYEVLLAGMPEGIARDKPVPLLVVLDGYLLGMTAIETARLMGAAGEVEPIVIAAVSPAGGFTAGNTRRLRDFSADSDMDVSKDPMIQAFLPRFEAMGLTVEEAVGGSDDFRKFLTDELLPEIRTMAQIDNARLGIFGHSAGGAFLIEALLEGDTPFSDYLIGEAGTFLLFGTGDALLEKAVSAESLPARRVIYADSSDMREMAPQMLEDAAGMISDIRDKVGVPVKSFTYEGETHTTMVPLFIKDSLLHMYGTGRTYADAFQGQEE